MSRLSEEGKAILRFVREQMEAVHSRLEQQITGVVAAQAIMPTIQVDTHPAAPEIRVENNVPTPGVSVQVDMAPVADAIREMGELFALAVEKLAEALAPRPAPEVVMPAPAERPARRIKIDHSDGTSSTVSEA